MRMRIPITGTVKAITPHIMGDDDDSIRPINIDLGDVGWKLIHLDLELEEMEIEITPNPETVYDTGSLSPDGSLEMKGRPTTLAEKNAAIEHALDRSLARMSKEALYALSGSPALKNPFKEIV